MDDKLDDNVSVIDDEMLSMLDIGKVVEDNGVEKIVKFEKIESSGDVEFEFNKDDSIPIGGEKEDGGSTVSSTSRERESEIVQGVERSE